MASHTHCESTFNTFCSEFKWTIHKFGLRFPEPASTLQSDVFEANKARFCIEARCQRQCPESQLRVYIRLRSYDDSHPGRGFYSLKAFYHDKELEEHRRVATNECDHFARHSTQDLDNEVFIGWANSFSAHLQRIVHVHMCHFPDEEDTVNVHPISEPQVPVSISEAHLTATIEWIIAKLVESIRKRSNKIHHVEEANDADEQTWQEYSRKLYQKLEYIINKKISKSLEDEIAITIPMKQASV